MKCPYCGNNISEETKFCPSCGAENEFKVEKNVEEIEPDTSEMTADEYWEFSQQEKERRKHLKTQGLGIAGFVISLVSLFFDDMWLMGIGSVLALIFSAIAMGKYNKEKHKNKGLAIAGFIISIILLGVIAIDLLFLPFSMLNI